MKSLNALLSNELKSIKSIRGGYPIGTRTNSGKCGLGEVDGWCYDTTDTATTNQEDGKWTESGTDAPDK